MILPSRQRVGSILIVNNDDNTSTLEVKDSGGREMTAEFLAQVNAGESTAVSEAISSAIAEQHESDLDTFASPTDVATAISDQHTTDLTIFSTPASVATAISAQHETDNATYAPISGSTVYAPASGSTAYGPSSLPTAALAAGSVGRYNPACNVYNLKPSNTRRLRAGLARARAGTGSLKIATIGDSTTAGYQALAATESWPVLLRKALAGAGYPTMGTGPVIGNPGGAPGGFLDGRYTFSGTWTTQAGNANFLRQTIVNGATATFASDVAGTIVEIKYLNNGGTFSYAIDGGAAVPVTPSGAGSIGAVTVTGLANTTHSVVITATSTSPFYLPWVDVRGATSGVLVANFGVNSTTTANWTNNTFYFPGPMSRDWAPNVTFIDLGINDLSGAVTTATYKANLQTLITAYAALGDVFLVIGNPTQSGDRSAYNAACYQLADSNDIPLIDLMERLGTWATMNVQGLTADASHPNAAGYAEKASGILTALGIPGLAA